MKQECTLTEIPGVGYVTERKLKEGGYETIESVAISSPKEIANITDFSERNAQIIIIHAKCIMGIINSETAYQEIANITGINNIEPTTTKLRTPRNPWSEIVGRKFIEDMLHNGMLHNGKTLDDNAVILSAKRVWGDSGSKFRWQLEWTGADAERHTVVASSLDILFIRASDVELENRARMREKP